MKEVERNKKTKKYSKTSIEESIFTGYMDKYNLIKDGKSNFYYIAVFVLNLCTLVISMLFLNNMANVNNFEIIADVFDIELFLLMILVFVLIQLLHSFPMFLRNYNFTKSRRFWAMFKANAVEQHYESLAFGSTKMITSTVYMEQHKVDVDRALDVAFSKKLYSKIALMTYATIIFIIGLFLWIDKVNVWMLTIGLFGYLSIVTFVIFVWYFARNKKSALNIIGNICKILYKLKLVKDYDTLFNNMSNKMMMYAKSLKAAKTLNFVEVISNILILFLKSLFIYFAFASVYTGVNDTIGQIIFNWLIFELILTMCPMPKGTLIFEFVFVVLFKNLFNISFVFWGLLIFKIFEYFMYIVQFCMVKIIDIIEDSVRNKKSKIDSVKDDK